MMTNFSDEEIRKEFERAEKSLKAAWILLKGDLLEDAIRSNFIKVTTQRCSIGDR